MSRLHHPVDCGPRLLIVSHALGADVGVCPPSEHLAVPPDPFCLLRKTLAETRLLCSHVVFGVVPSLLSSDGCALEEGRRPGISPIFAKEASSSVPTGIGNHGQPLVFKYGTQLIRERQTYCGKQECLPVTYAARNVRHPRQVKK